MSRPLTAKELLAALKKWGPLRHVADCCAHRNFERECTCGLYEFKQRLDKEPTP